jgi:hypothetical protein
MLKKLAVSAPGAPPQAALIGRAIGVSFAQAAARGSARRIFPKKAKYS